MFKKIKDIMSKKDKNTDQLLEKDQDASPLTEEQTVENKEEITSEKAKKQKKRSKKPSKEELEEIRKYIDQLEGGMK